MNVRSFIILGLGEGVTSFDKNNRANFSGGKTEYNGAFRGINIFKNTRKNFKLNLVLVLEFK